MLDLSWGILVPYSDQCSRQCVVLYCGIQTGNASFSHCSYMVVLVVSRGAGSLRSARSAQHTLPYVHQPAHQYV